MSRPLGLLLLVATGISTLGCVQVQSGEGGFVMGGRIDVDRGEVTRDDIVAMGGSVRIDGEARRDVVVILGRLVVNGEVGGDVSCVGGALELGPRSRVAGDVVVVGGSYRRDPSAEIGGEIVNVSFGTDIPRMFGSGLPFWAWWGFSPFAWFWRVIQLSYWLVLALLTVALVGDRVSSASHAVQREPLRLGAIGLVGLFALCFAFVVLVVMSLLIIGIPFLLALIFVWWLAYIFGLVAVFQAVGNRVMNMVGRPDATQLGIVLVGALVLCILRALPFGFGTLLWFVAALVGLGSVFATRFGTGRPWVHRSGTPPGGYPPPGGGSYAPPQPPPEAGERASFAEADAAESEVTYEPHRGSGEAPPGQS